MRGGKVRTGAGSELPMARDQGAYFSVAHMRDGRRPIISFDDRCLLHRVALPALITRFAPPCGIVGESSSVPIDHRWLLIDPHRLAAGDCQHAFQLLTGPALYVADHLAELMSRPPLKLI